METPENIVKRGKEWVEGFHLLVEGVSVTKVAEHIGIARGSLHRVIKCDNWQASIDEKRRCLAKLLDEETEQEALRVRRDGMRTAATLQKALDGKLGEIVDEEGLKKVVLGHSKEGEPIFMGMSLSLTSRSSHRPLTTSQG